MGKVRRVRRRTLRARKMMTKRARKARVRASPKTKSKTPRIPKHPPRNRKVPRQSLMSPPSLPLLQPQRISISIQWLHSPQMSFHKLLRNMRRTSLQPMHSLRSPQQPRTPTLTQLHRILKMTDAYRLRKFYLVEAIRSNLVDKRDKIIAQLHRL